MFSRVVLPQPDGPSSAYAPPSASWRSIRFSAQSTSVAGFAR